MIDFDCLLTEKILYSLRAVLRPAEDGREREQQERYRDEHFARTAEQIAECLRDECSVVYALNRETCFEIYEAGRENYYSRHGADYEGVEEYFENAPHTLLYRLVDV